MMHPCFWIQLTCKCSSIRQRLTSLPQTEQIKCPGCQQLTGWMFLVSGQSKEAVDDTYVLDKGTDWSLGIIRRPMAVHFRNEEKAATTP